MEYKGGKPQVPRASGDKIAPQEDCSIPGSRQDRKPATPTTIFEQQSSQVTPIEELVTACDKELLNYAACCYGDDIATVDELQAFVIEELRQNQVLREDVEKLRLEREIFDSIMTPDPRLIEEYRIYLVLCEEVGFKPLEFEPWWNSLQKRVPLEVEEFGLVTDEGFIGETVAYAQTSPSNIVEERKEVVVVDKSVTEGSFPIICSMDKKKIKRISYAPNPARIERVKSQTQRVFCEEIEKFNNDYIAGEPNKRLRTARNPQNDSLKLEHKFEPVSYCRAVQFLKVPVSFPAELNRIQKLYPHLVAGPFDLLVLKEAFRSVNEVLYELCWFVTAEVVSYKISNKYLYHFFHNGRQLTHLRAKQVTENYRQEDAMTYWTRNYALFLSIFCGRKTNRFTKRIVEYMNDQGTMYEISQGVALCAKPPKKSKKLPRGPVRQFNDERDRSVRGVRNKYVESKDSFEPQMMGMSSIYSTVREGVVNSASSLILDSVTQAVKEIPNRIMSGVATTIAKGNDLFRSIKDFIIAEYEVLKGVVKSIFESISDETKIFVVVGAFTIFLLLLFMYIFRRMFDKCKKVFSLCLCSALDYLGCDLSKRDIGKIQEIFEYEYEKQSLSELAPVVGLALGAALSACSKTDSQTAGAVINFASRFPTVFTSVEDCICSSFDYIYHWYYGEHYLKDKKLLDEFDEFAKDFKEFCEIPDVENVIDKDLGTCLKLEQLHKRAKILEPLTLHIRTNPALATCLARAFAKVNSLFDAHRQTADLYATRIETVCCWLYGESGQGKTKVYPHIVAGVYELVRDECPQLLPFPYGPAHTHHRNKLSQYWEGYERQFCCVWNEALEKEDPQERQRTLSEFLTACETGTFPLDMAFERKGKAFFNSMLAMITSNFTDSHLQRESHMTFPEAIVRRRTLYLEVRRKADFKTWKEGDKIKGNFDEAWNFILRIPDIEKYQNCFYLGLPKNLHEVIMRDKCVNVPFSCVISLLADQIIQRQSTRQDEAEFMRQFSYKEYVTESRATVEPYSGPVFKPELAEKKVQEKKVQKSEYRSARRERRFAQYEFESTSPEETKKLTPMDTTTFTSLSPSQVENRPPVPPPKPRTKSEPTFIPQMMGGFESWWYEPENVVRTTINKVHETVAPVHYELKQFCHESMWGEGEGLYVEDQQKYTHFVSGLSFEDKEKHCEIVSRMCRESFPLMLPFCEVFQRKILDSDPRVNRQAEELVRLLYIHLFFYNCVNVEFKDYIIKKFRRLGVKHSPFLTSPDLVVHTLKTFRDVEVIKNQFYEITFFKTIFSFFIDGICDGPDHWTTRLFNRIYRYRDSFDGPCSLTGKQCVRLFSLTGPWFDVEEKFLGGSHWTDWGSVLYSRWSNYYSDVFGKFMSKYSLLVFGAAASILAIGISVAVGHKIDEDRKQSVKEKIATFKPPPVHGSLGGEVVFEDYPHEKYYDDFGDFKWCDRETASGYVKPKPYEYQDERGKWQVRESLTDQVNNNVVHRGNSAAQSLGRGHDSRLKPRAVHGHSLGRGHKHVMKVRGVAAHSMPRGIDARMKARGVHPHSEEELVEKWIVDAAFSQGYAWVVAAFKTKSLVESMPHLTEFVRSRYADTVADAIMDVLEEMAILGEEPSFENLHTIVFNEWEEWPEDQIVKNTELIRFLALNDHDKQKYLHQAKRDGGWDYSLLSFLHQNTGFVVQSGSTQQIYNFSQHMRTIEVTYPDNKRVYTDGIISGSRFITVGHFFDQYGLDFISISFRNAQGILATAFKTQLVVAPLPYRRDLFYIDFPATALSPFKSLKPKLFKNLKDMEERMAVDGDFCRLSRTVMPDGSILIEKVTRHHIQRGEKTITQHYINNKYVPADHDLYYLMIDGMGVAGDCGQPYLWTDPTGVVYLVGIHTGRTGLNSYFSPIFQEDLSSKFFAQCYIPEYLPIDTPAVSKMVQNEKYLYLGKAPKPKIIPSESRLRPSPAQGDFNREPLYGEPTTAPGLLRETWIEGDQGGHVATPLKNAKKKLSGAPVRPMKSWFQEVVDRFPEKAFEGFFPRGMDLRNVRMWTIEEALFGIPGVWDGFTRDTAIGYDIECAMPKIRSRKELWDPETKWIHPLLRILVQKIFDAIDRGELPRHVVAGCLKDETRPIDKTEFPRLFMIGSLSHQIFTVMCCGALVTEMKRCRASSDSAIGTNIHGFDWKAIYQKVLSGKTWKFINGDGKFFDSSICPWPASFLAQACLPYYGFSPSDKRYRYVQAAFLSSVGPILVLVDEVYDLSFMNPSGQWLTGFLNTFVNQIGFNFFFMWVVEQHKAAHPELENFTRSQAMPLALYGDDNLAAVIKEFQKFCTMNTFGQFLYENFGITYTTAQKKLELPDFVPKEEAEFLARKFRVEGGNVKAPLSEESIYSMVYWIREPPKDNPEGNTLDSQFLVNLEQAHQEWFHYGKDRFELEADKIRQMCHELGILYPGKTYDEYADRWLLAQRD